MSRILKSGAGDTSRQHKVGEEMPKYIHTHVLSAESGWNIGSLGEGLGMRFRVSREGSAFRGGFSAPGSQPVSCAEHKSCPAHG